MSVYFVLEDLHTQSRKALNKNKTNIRVCRTKIRQLKNLIKELEKQNRHLEHEQAQLMLDMVSHRLDQSQ